MPSVEGAGGRPVGLLLGFANVLLSTWRATQPRAVIVCLDTRVPSYRHELLPAYQGQRDPFADDLCEQLDRLPELSEAFGFAAAKVTTVRSGRSAGHGGHPGGGARRRSTRLLERPRHLPTRLRRDGDAASAAARRARARRSRRRARALRHRAGAGARPDRTAWRPLRQHPGRARHRAEDRGRAAAALRRPGRSDRSRRPSSRRASARGRGRRGRSPALLDVATMRRDVALAIPVDASLDRSPLRPGARRPACSLWPGGSPPSARLECFG